MKKEIVAKGIDVSEHQGVIDWEAVKRSGMVEFAVLRAGYGKDESQIDKQFERNYAECQRLGIPVGAYWYSYAISAAEARQEAMVFLSVIAGKSFEFPLAYDVEEERTFKSGNASEICNEFCKIVGKETAIYSFKSAFENYIRTSQPVFLSHVGVSESDYAGDYDLWQYSWTGRIPGIAEDVDLDYAYRRYDTAKTKSELELLSEILTLLISIDEKLKKC